MFARLPTTFSPSRTLAVLRGERRRDDPDELIDHVSGAGVPEDVHERAGLAPVGRRVLIVDDEPSIRMLCAVNLELGGFVVTEAENGAEALELAWQGEYDLVLLDVMLPDIGGHEVARRLARRRRTRDVPVVFISARADKADLRLGFEVGGLDYITKPFDPTALGRRLEEVLARVARGEGEAFRRTRLDELAEEQS